jgi:TonB family protein
MKFRILFTLFFVLSIFVANDAAQETVLTTKTINAGVVNSKAVTLPKPEYPQAAQSVRASGEVKVQVVIDEQGNVTSAEAISGHPLLRQAAEKAARQSKFTPTYLTGQAVKVTGAIVYNFVPTKAPNYENEVRAVAVGIALYTARELEASDEIDSMLIDVADFYPDELKSLKSVKGVSRQKRTEIINEALSAFKAKLNASESWQFELGEALGAIMVLASKYESSNFNGKVDGVVLKTSLQKIRDLSLSAPSDFPADVLEKIKDIGTLAENTLEAEELLAATVVKVVKLVNTISPD